MGNCLITKLKSTVENSSLIGLGELEFTVTKAMAFNYRNFKDSKVLALDGGYFKATIDGTVVGTNLNEVSVPANSWTIIELSGTMPYRVRVTEKYSIDNFEPQDAYTIDATQFEYSTQMSRCELYFADITKGDISVFAKCPSLNYLAAAGSNIKGSINSLSALTNLTAINLAYTPINGDVSNINSLNLATLSLNNSYVGGNLSDIARLTKLQSLAVGNPYIDGNISSLGTLIELTGTLYLGSNCAGTIESMADGMIAAGRTSGTLIVSCYPNKVTYNGNGVSKVTITFSGGSYNVVVNS